ncbi:PEP-CTERM sorting domain-containing protein [Phragmitibacter flavus]|uniref:PEP-CTERM sorting domain-containing protein n=1 Tax=Phragmitibacter flavus TaxID=2576071 RepID=A0A5R8KJG3_9BACT|nr:autotransporter-associated beta strand repeat-containing protein [Phragmitibacter flavus]TLD72468.1 PEP-CTERM sorting domain-containing protein [Phragmitibacter flavus]
MIASTSNNSPCPNAFAVRFFLGLFLSLPFLPTTTEGANASWIGGTGTQAWDNVANWAPGIPGANPGTTNADIATFNTATTGTLVTIDAGRNIGSLRFSTGASGSYTIGSAGINLGETLRLSSGGSIVMDAGVTSPVTINAPLIIEPTSATGNGTYTFTNNSASADADPNTYKMILNGGISGGTTTGTITLNFTGSAGNRSNDNSGNLINGLISNGGASSLALNITGLSNQRGVWRITNDANSFTGNVAINTGTLLFTSIANIGQNSSLGAGNAVTLGSGIHLKYVGTSNQTTNRTITGGGAFYNNTGGTTLTLTGAVGSGITYRGGGNFDIQGLITGTSGISRTDPGTVFLNNDNNSFSGDVGISDGAFRGATLSNNGTDAASNSAFGRNGRILFGQGSSTTGRLEYTGVTTSTDRLVVMRNDAAGNTGRGVIDVFTAGETLTFTNDVRVGSAAAANIAELTLRGSGNGVIQGQIGGTTGNAAAVASLRLFKSGTGTWTLTSANTYTRETNINAGVLNIQDSNALGAVLSNETTPTAVGAGTTVASGATLQLQNNISVGAEALSLNGTGASGQTGALVNVSGTNNFGGALSLAGNTTIASDSGRLNLTNTTAIAGTSRTLTLAGAGDGSLAAPLESAAISTLTKNGTGLWTVSGANTYTGTTTVNAGILNVTGSLANTAVNVNNTATFAHIGTVGSTTIANGGSLLVGNAEVPGSTGTLGINGNLILNQNSALIMDLGTASDLINVTGDLTLDGIARISPGAGFTAGSYRLIDYTGSLTDNVLTAQVIAGYDLSVDTTIANQVNLLANAITAAQYWDGVNTTANGIVDGGPGIWTNATTNFTSADGTTNTSWAAATEKIAIFAGAAGGTVQVQDDIEVNGLQFAQNYALTDAGGELQIANAATEVRINLNTTADISAAITGAGGINKTGDGTLLFSAPAGTHTYAGPTRITSGILKAGVDNALPTNTAVIVGGNVSAVGVATTDSTFDLSTASQQVSSLTLTGNNTTLASNVIIGSGETLTVTGTGGLITGVANSAKNTTLANFTGGGNLVVNNATANVELGLQTATSFIPGMTESVPPAPPINFDDGSNRNTTTTDFTQLGSLTATVNEFRVGHGLNNSSTVLLSNTANTITAEVVQLSNSAGWNAGTATVVLGTGTNVINTDLLNIGTSKGVATLRFASQTAGSPGSVVIGGKDSAEVDIIIGSSQGTNTGATPTGTLDLRGHDATVVADSVLVGHRDNAGGGGSSGTIHFSQGTFSANSVTLGFMSGNALGTANGVLNLSGGTFTVNDTFTLATFNNTIVSPATTAAGNARATVNITGGTLISNTDILEGGGTNATATNTISTINLNGGTLDMTGHSIGDATNTINVLTLASGALKDVAEINGGGDIEKTTGGTLTLLGNNTYTGNTTITAGILRVGDGGDNGTLGTGGDVINNATLALNRNNLLTVANNISGSGVLNQTGTGTSVLSGTNTYIGLTTVSAGTLLANNDYLGTNSATGSNDVSVTTGATFGGNGFIEGDVTIGSGAFFSPGGNTETVTAAVTGLSTDTGTMRILGHLSLNSGATMNLDLKTNGSHGLTATFDPATNRLTSVTGTSLDGGNDRVIIEGDLILDPNATISLTLGSGYTPNYRDVFDLMDWVGTIPLGFYGDASGIRTGNDNDLYSLDLPDLSAYNSEWFWDVSQFGTTGVVAIVPEPGRMLLLAAALIGFTLRRRRALR